MFTTITNYAQIKYQTDSGKQHTITASPCTALISSVDLSLQIICDKKFAEVGEEFTYTFLFTNMTQLTLRNVVCHHFLCPYLTYVPDSMTYNCVSLHKTECDTDIALPDLAPFKSGLLQFKVYAHELPDPTNVTSSYNVTYDVLMASPGSNVVLQPMDINPFVPDVLLSDIRYSEIVTTTISESRLLLEQVPDSTILTKNSNIHLTGTVTNSSSNNINDTFVQLKFPDGASYAHGSLFVDDVSVPLTSALTFSIGTLPPQAIIYYGYDMHIDEELPNGDLTGTATSQGINTDPLSPQSIVTSNQVTNTYTIESSTHSLKLVKSANCNNVELGDSFTYYLSIYNPNNYAITSLNLKDILPSGLSYLPNSMKINTVNVGLQTFTGFLILPDLEPKKNHRISFRVRLDALPAMTTISNHFTLDYIVADSQQPIQYTAESNNLVLSICQGNLQLEHTPDRLCLHECEDITYSGKLTNLSSYGCLAAYISFCFLEGTSIHPDSVLVHGLSTSFSTNSELYIGDLSPGETIYYQFTLHFTMPHNNSLFDSAVAYGRLPYNNSSHPAILSNTVVNTYTRFVKPHPPVIPVSPPPIVPVANPLFYPNSYPDYTTANTSGISADNLLLLVLLISLFAPSS